VQGGTLERGCIRATGNAPATAELRLPRPLIGQLAALRVAPASGLPPAGQPVYVDNSLAYPPNPSVVLPRTAGGSVTLDVGQTTIAGVRFTVSPGADLCVKSIDVGQVLPAPA
jgi:hypothetical protein